MSHSPLQDVSTAPDEAYFDGWAELAERIRRGQSFSGRERNCCFLNTRGPRWADVSAAFGLDLIDDSRSIASVDWDHDGDLDLWLTARTGPRVRFLRNDLPRSSNTFIAFQLRGNPTRGCPADAIGARVILEIRGTDGESQRRIQTLSAGDAFLSQSSKIVHFGLLSGEKVEAVSVRWPGSTTTETWTRLDPGRRYFLEQGASSREAVALSERLLSDPVDAIPSREADMPEGNSSETSARVWLSAPLPMDRHSCASFQTQEQPLQVPSVGSRPTLLTLWASWCNPCVVELAEWGKKSDEFADANVDIVALTIEDLEGRDVSGAETAKAMAEQLALPFQFGFATNDLIQHLNALRNEALYRRDPLPLPVSFLIDARGQLRTIYAGSTPVEQILEDIDHLTLDGEANQNRAVPFRGQWAGPRFVTHPIAIAEIFRSERQYDEARQYLERYLERTPAPPADLLTQEAMTSRRRLADVYQLLGRIAFDEQKLDVARQALVQSLSYHPKHLAALIDLGELYQRTGELESATRTWIRATEIQPRQASLWNRLGLLWLQRGDAEKAEQTWQRALSVQPDYVPAANNLAWLWATHADAQRRKGPQAVELAEQLVARQGARADLLDTLAASLAETGQYERAEATAQQALRLATQDGHSELATAIQARLELYRQRKPFHEPVR